LLQALCEWLSNTPLSMAIQDAFWVIPTVQTVHIVAIAVVMGSIAMLDLRLVGIFGRTQSVDSVAQRFLPWVWAAVLVLLASGSILIIGEPGRELLNVMFWLKMSMLTCVLIITATFQYLLRSHGSAFWERRRVAAGLVGIVSLLLWVSIIGAGRWIAYVEHG
jgi:Family of unknown function (DUF6644)